MKKKLKLKKKVKIVLIFILLIGGSISFISFNKWFFSRYKDIINKEEKEEVKTNGKEIIDGKIIDDNNSVETGNNSDTKKVKFTESNTIEASKEYYCYDGAKLEGNKCVMTMEMAASNKNNIKIVSDNEDSIYIEIQFEWETKEDENFIREACKSEKGTFKVDNINDRIGACIFTDNSFQEEVEESKANYYCIGDDYKLVGNKCVKEYRTNALERYSCPDGYTQDGFLCKK